jgi:long-subunit acyl-CoA synthetase (AMP-forming)
VARVDDLIVMANGEKAIPTPLESALLSHPSVHGAIAFGRSRDQIGILVEPVQSALADVNHESLSAFRDLIWFVHSAIWRACVDLFTGQL